MRAQSSISVVPRFILIVRKNVALNTATRNPCVLFEAIFPRICSEQDLTERVLISDEERLGLRQIFKDIMVGAIRLPLDPGKDFVLGNRIVLHHYMPYVGKNQRDEEEKEDTLD